MSWALVHKRPPSSGGPLHACARLAASCISTSCARVPCRPCCNSDYRGSVLLIYPVLGASGAYRSSCGGRQLPSRCLEHAAAVNDEGWSTGNRRSLPEPRRSPSPSRPGRPAPGFPTPLPFHARGSRLGHSRWALRQGQPAHVCLVTCASTLIATALLLVQVSYQLVMQDDPTQQRERSRRCAAARSRA